MRWFNQKFCLYIYLDEINISSKCHDIDVHPLSAMLQTWPTLLRRVSAEDLCKALETVAAATVDLCGRSTPGDLCSRHGTCAAARA